MSIEVKLQSAGGVNMGNILESDNSGSDVEFEDSNRVGRNEERSQGDGRESDADDLIDKLNSNILTHKVLSKSAADPNSNLPRKGAQPAVAHTSKTDNFQSSMILQRESPKQLPPKGQLIPLKPERIPKASSSSALNDDYSSPPNKQREPKFVPYEPYAGAVRPMTDDYKKHSRKASNSSTVSGMSIGIGCSPQNTSANGPGPQTAQDNTLQHHINHYKNQTHSMTLMKERLKIGEKDIAELQAENARLKKLMVDSMLGSTGANSDIKGSGGTENGINEDSFENLNDEIEVWRSKFLSSCILVDQLTKENREMKVQISSAAHLFREIKNTAGLTASLFDQINHWLSQNASQLDYNYNTSSDDYNYDLSPHPPSPYS